jgi:ATP-dependent RNA helicase RhlE
MKFQELNINKSLLNALNDLGLESPTAIQEKVFSIVMSGKDVCAIAQTGTGKTLAYLLPLLRLWTYSKEKLPQILVLVPTRELVIQVVEMAKELTKYISFDVIGVYGGVNLKIHVSELSKGCDLLVATPGRLIDLASSGTLKVKNIKKLVIDEFDMMLDLGFRPQLKTIFDKIPERRQNLLFSATLTEEVESLLDVYFKNPVLIETSTSGTPLENINQKAYEIPNFQTKINFLELLLVNDKEMKKNLVFVSNKALADLLFNQLLNRDLQNIDVIHSNKSQNYRFKAVENFENGITNTLIATDIISRGLDLTGVSHVVNFDLPEEPESYIHRIGRTGRNSNNGIAISFFTPKDLDIKSSIEKLMSFNIPAYDTPEFLEISNEIMPFEREESIMKVIEIKPIKKEKLGAAFHEKKEKNKKVNVRRNIEEEKKRKYGKAYRKES